MDFYVRNFDLDEIVQNFKECNEVLKINNVFENITILHNNIRSIQRNYDEFIIAISQLEKLPDCIVLTETHQVDCISLYNFKDYNTIYNEAKFNKNDGTIVYLKKDIPYSTSCTQLHGVTILQVEFSINNKTCLLIAAYRSPALLPRVFVDDLEQLLNHKEFKRNMSEKNWDFVYTNPTNINELNNITDTFLQTINDEISMCTRYKKIDRRKTKRKTWITNAIVNSVNKKNMLYEQTKQEPENLKLRCEYNEYKANLKNIIEFRKSEYYKQQIHTQKSDSKKIWNIVKEIEGKKYPSVINTIKDEDGVEYRNEIDIANKFNEVFCGVGPKLAQNITPDPGFVSRRKILPNSFYLSETNSSEIKSIINQLKIKKAGGIDKMKSETLKIVSDFVSVPLAYIRTKAAEINSFFKTHA
nr:unnamed protein product [Callosobruchus chinensis]